MTLKIGMIQTCSSDQPEENLKSIIPMIYKAHKQGARFIVTPEVSNCISRDPMHQQQVLCPENKDESLAKYCEIAADLQVWLLIGSLALKTDDAHGRFANRSFLIDPNGQIVARYDKIHMFDVALSEVETYAESATYRPGQQAVLKETEIANIGLTICYDLRFPSLFRQLAQAGAQIITVPSAFATITGKAHWHVLLRARAIETGCYIIAPAQSGIHSASVGVGRETYGHSLVVNPWGDIIADAKSDVGVTVVEIDLKQVETARKRIPSLEHDRNYKGPICQM